MLVDLSAPVKIVVWPPVTHPVALLAQQTLVGLSVSMQARASYSATPPVMCQVNGVRVVSPDITAMEVLSLAMPLAVCQEKRTVGGLAGANEGRIASSYATGNVSGEHSVGGLVGRNQYGSIKFSYTTSKVSQAGDIDNAAIGGFLGTNAEEGVVAVSYWLRELPVRHAGVGEGSSTGVRALDAEQMQAPSDYTDIYSQWHSDSDNADEDYDETTGRDDFWDFGSSNDYPALKLDVDDDGIATWVGRWQSAW